jgi:hypothetical protein
VPTALTLIFAQGFADVLFSERALAAEGLEGAL